MKDYNAARPLFERALKVNEKAFGAEHQAVAVSLTNLAELVIFLSKGKDIRHLGKLDEPLA